MVHSPYALVCVMRISVEFRGRLFDLGTSRLSRFGAIEFTHTRHLMTLEHGHHGTQDVVE